MSAEQARHVASAILAERRFHNPSVPRPLHGPLHAIGTAIEDAGRAIAHAVDRLGTVVPGGSPVVWMLLAIAFVALCSLIASRYSTRLLLEPVGARQAARGARPERAADLERAAGRAERGGRYEEAVRLRFRAGLMRLAERELIRTARTVPTAEVARSLHSSRFDALARRFDEIAYGGSSADEADALEARREWPQVIERAGVR